MENIRRSGIKKVELSRDYIGTGAYGVVWRALCNDTLWCAAKVIHEILRGQGQETPQHPHRTPLQRFHKESELLASLTHPNIVLYLGTYTQPRTNLPMLLMELLDENLTSFLERQGQPLSYRTEVSISYDVSLGLAFLHSNNIIHRDLSSNNVLMLGNRQAKISDFGMARIFEEASHLQSITPNPGNALYMPPEVKTVSPRLGFEIDIFSFGTLLVQILTRLFPAKDEKALLGLAKLFTADKEIATRQTHISLIDKDHPLLHIALLCLKDDYKKRPDSVSLCQELAGAKSKPFALKSAAEEKMVGNAGEEDLKCSYKEEYVHIEAPGPAAPRYFTDKSNNLECVKPKFSSKPTYGCRDEDGFVDIELPENIPPQTEAIVDKSTELNIQWSFKSTTSPMPISRPANAVHIKKFIYILCGEDNRSVIKFNHLVSTGSNLKEVPLAWSSLAVIGDDVTTIGGTNGQKTASNQLYRLEGDNWVEVVPSMPTKRYKTITASCDSHVVVAGGLDKNREILTTVEVLDLKKHEWCTVSSLPKPSAGFSGCICEGQVWVTGYYNKMFSCSLEALLGSSKKFYQFEPSSSDIWSSSNMPVYATTLVALNDKLYAIGGKRIDTKTTTNAVYQYNSWSSNWCIFSHMNEVRSDCVAVGISFKKQMFVMGGVSDSDSPVPSVEAARFFLYLSAKRS